MTVWKDYRLLMIGLLIVLAASFVLAQLNAKEAECESITGKIVKLFDMDAQKSCARISTWKFLAYTGIAIGSSFVVIQFVRRK